MALKITPANEVIEVKRLCLTIYSQPGLGKTSLAFTASRPLLFDFDQGAYRASNRGDTVQVETWGDVANATAADLEPYDTIILDTVGKALDFLTADILANNGKLGWGGALNQQGWGQLGVRFRAFLKKMEGFGKDVILLSHMDEKADGDTIKERLKIQGGSKDLVLTDSDVIARIAIHNRERQLNFSPTETSFGKDPGNIGMAVIPDATSPAYRTFLAETIEGIKTALNSLSEEQTAHKSEVEWFEQTLPDMTCAADINEFIGRAKKAGRDVALMLKQRADELGLEFDPDSKQYMDPDGEEPEEWSDPDPAGNPARIAAQ